MEKIEEVDLVFCSQCEEDEHMVFGKVFLNEDVFRFAKARECLRREAIEYAILGDSTKDLSVWGCVSPTKLN